MDTHVVTLGAGATTVEEMIDGFGRHNLMAGWDVLA
jgi:hypothetical protein